MLRFMEPPILLIVISSEQYGQERAAMDFCVLGLLLMGPLSLYQLNAAFERSLSLFYRASLGALQASIKKLLAAGYIELASVESGGRRAKLYRIRDEGRARFTELLHEPLPESRLEETALARYFFLGLVPSSGERVAILDRIIADASRSLAGLEASKSELSKISVPASYAGILSYQVGTLDYGITAHKAAIRWFKRRRALERAKARLETDKDH
jgi:DNA-binding PadR family transcriptional regulator